MLRTLCKSKITNVFVTSKELKYSGSMGIDSSIIEAADLLPGEQVHVLNVNNANRFTTYVIEEKSGSGKIVLYGPAARLGEPGDELVLLSYCQMETKECRNFKIRKISLGKNNRIKK
ncbi:MAG: aspartate 1-decarboxylase [Candidatus Omnitrophica bacterium]|nr:aspartate 1-decarboxylase [Candidatus Omnitrophota bacterium]